MKNYEIISSMVKSMLEANIYSHEDIVTIGKLELAYLEKCESISLDCAREGYPSHGSNYELRCAQARSYYEDEIRVISSKYEEVL